MKATIAISSSSVSPRSPSSSVLTLIPTSGTGQQFDWQRIPQHCSRPLILAGGLTVQNVAEAIHLVRPYAVDVSGGVELHKGIKDQDKIRQFINEVNSIGASKTH